MNILKTLVKIFEKLQYDGLCIKVTGSRARYEHETIIQTYYNLYYNSMV